ncbi:MULTISPECIES: hypothetical protein [Streptomyces]|uniref:Uncharacterized protein n=1 Tax=Streptomyces dengpaensis TaxID=2049881 RepID=A0ABN5IBW5_9ACTN|nr:MULTISPECIES: hypothetical protein [Streptomyces]AVH60563.1 hypothetical protein C4B68_37725 [Streptomyces dengpaensis]PIB04478.1 hypothetical protein B1C81_33210 [Streptomyces sp. HG99]
MTTSQSDSTVPSDDKATPDALLHTGSGGPVTAEDLVLAAGRDITPKNMAWAERKLREEGPAAMDKLLP